MKRIFISFLLFLAFTMTNYGQSAVSGSIMKAIRENKPEEMKKYLNKVSDLDLVKYHGQYNKDQAVKIIEEFFKPLKVESCSVKRQGKTDDGGDFTLSLMRTNKGDYTVYFILKQADQEWLIHHLKIQKQ